MSIPVIDDGFKIFLDKSKFVLAKAASIALYPENLVKLRKQLEQNAADVWINT